MKLTVSDAYLMMFQFLDEYWRRASMNSSTLHTEDLARLLGGLSPITFSDGKPADPATWKDWHDCVTAVNLGKKDLTEEDSFNCMVSFLALYHNEFGFELSSIIGDLNTLKSTRKGQFMTWDDWIHSIRR